MEINHTKVIPYGHNKNVTSMPKYISGFLFFLIKQNHEEKSEIWYRQLIKRKRCITDVNYINQYNQEFTNIKV